MALAQALIRSIRHSPKSFKLASALSILLLCKLSCGGTPYQSTFISTDGQLQNKAVPKTVELPGNKQARSAADLLFGRTSR